MQEGLMKDILEGKKYSTDLLIVIILSVIAVIGSVILPEGHIFRIVLGIPLLLFLPGYVLAAVLWPEKHESVKYAETSQETKDAKNKPMRAGINNLERIALSFGLSIVVVSFLGLALNYTSTGITFYSTLLGNFAVIMIFVILAYYRRFMTPDEKRFTVNFHLSTKLPQDGTEKVFVLAIASILVISCGVLAYAIVTPSPEEIYTAFYILDENRTATNFQKNITVNETVTVNIGIINNEYSEIDYTIVAGIDNQPNTIYTSNWDDVYVLANGTEIFRNITLDNKEIFEDDFQFEINEPGQYLIVWQLLIHGEPSNYEVRILVNANAA